MNYKRDTSELGLVMMRIGNAMLGADVMNRKPCDTSEITKTLDRRSFKDFLERLTDYGSLELFGVPWDSERGIPSGSEDAGGLVARITGDMPAQMFIFNAGLDDQYLVDRQGYDYMRYMVKLV